jgi:putative transposase
LSLIKGLALQTRRPRRRRSAVSRVVLPKATRRNQIWSMDFVSDELGWGRRFRVLTLVDHFTRESPALEVGSWMGGRRVVEVLTRLSAIHGLPEVIQVDNGPEFTSKALDQWAYENGVRLEFIRPGRPVENAFIESFNASLRKECLNAHWFQSIEEARWRVEEWRKEYNGERPHSSLGDLTPREYAREHEPEGTSEAEVLTLDVA